MKNDTDTVTRIMDVALRLMQQQGYNAFSYADISNEVGIRKASIHYYFPGKVDLARAVLVRYRNMVDAAMTHLLALKLDARTKLEQVIEFFGQLLRDDNRICLCGALSAELPGLPEVLQLEIRGYYDDLERGFSQIISDGMATGTFHIKSAVEDAARTLVAGVEGAMLVARSFNDPDRAIVMGHQLIKYLL